MQSETRPLSIVIPTYRREQVLLDTIEHLLNLKTQATEILVVDQTPVHEPATNAKLEQLSRTCTIRWIRRDRPSITAAMNHGLRAATNELVLFVDDDIEPTSDLVRHHSAALEADDSLWATVGQVVQPWQTPTPDRPQGTWTGLRKDLDFRFNSTVDSEVENAMAGNMCVHRSRVLAIGGFDENFLGSAIQFETDFARRIIRAGGRIRFLGSAGIRHLAAGRGGTRAHGGHLCCGNAMHSVGGYYFAFRNAPPLEAWTYSGRRFLRQVRTRFHLTHPWWIPVKLWGEVRALLLARRLHRQGPKFCRGETGTCAGSHTESAASR